MSQIECKICGKKFEQITNTHLRMHNYTPAQYKEEFKISKLVTDEVGNKISESKIGHVVTKETREKLRIANIGKIRSGESKLKQSVTINNFWNRNSERKKELSLKYSGENGPFYGKHHTEENKMKMGGAVIDYSGKNNPMYGKTHSKETRDKMSMSKTGITVVEYIKMLPIREQYYKRVDRITKIQPLYILENYDKPRGLCGVEGAYQLDHIIPVSYGFKNDIDPEIIGNISNLQFISWELNNEKSNNYEERI